MQKDIEPKWPQLLKDTGLPPDDARKGRVSLPLTRRYRMSEYVTNCMATMLTVTSLNSGSHPHN